jgi:hypothetical protein
MIADRLGFSGEILESAGPSPRSRGVNRQVADIARIRSVGWMPTVDLGQSVDALITGVIDPAGRTK